MIESMGRIRIKTVKSVAKKIIQAYPTQIKSDFSANKLKLPELAQILSKKLRNKIAGYLVALNKAKSMPKRIRVRPEEQERGREGSRERFRERPGGGSRDRPGSGSKRRGSRR